MDIKFVYGHVTTNSGRRVLLQITFYVTSVRKTTPEHIRTETSRSHTHFQSRLRLHHFPERDSELGIARLSCIPACSLSDGGDWRKYAE